MLQADSGGFEGSLQRFLGLLKKNCGQIKGPKGLPDSSRGRQPPVVRHHDHAPEGAAEILAA